MKLYFLAPLFLQKLIWIPTRLILVIFGHIQIYGLEHLRGLKSPVIFACNHSSEIDPILIPASLPFFSNFSPIFYTSRERGFYKNSGIRKFFYGGLLFKIWGSYPVFAGLRDYKKSLFHHISIINSGGSLCIFPEGSITQDGSIQPAHGGVAYLADHTNSVIIPVKISGVFRTSLVNFIKRKNNIYVVFGRPVHKAELFQKIENEAGSDQQSYKSKANYVMEIIKSLNEKSHQVFNN